MERPYWAFPPLVTPYKYPLEVSSLFFLMTPHTKQHYPFPVEQLSPDRYDSEDEARENAIRKYRKENKLPVVFYTPPPGIEYIEKQGRWIFGVPVWDQESADKALQAFKDMLSAYLRVERWGPPTIDLERLFKMANAAADLVALFDEEK